MDDQPEQAATRELPDDVEQLLDQADLIAIVQQHGRALDAHRKEMLLLWLSVVLVTGLLTYKFALEALHGDA